jgi:hypothetical protein
MLKLEARFLQPADVPAILALEHAKWEPHQAADADTLRQRIASWPQLAVGAFCTSTGRALASLFLRPTDPAMFTAPVRWSDSAAPDAPLPERALAARSLFGISMSSIDPKAVDAIFRFFYPHLLKAGWRDIYLGSPIPGFRKARERNPGLSVWQYVHAKRPGRHVEPLDPQLRYYHRKGFRRIVSIQKDYFPHAASLDYGVIVRCTIPLSRPAPLWQGMPFPLLQGLSGMLYRFTCDHAET